MSARSELPSAGSRSERGPPPLFWATQRNVTLKEVTVDALPSQLESLEPNDSPAENDTVSEAALSDGVVSASQPFVGRWNKLVSTTNWEKGRIIVQWRDALVDQEAAITEFSDEAWARLVGGVTGQHVGRLRRVFQRFGNAYEQFPQLFWSHFQAAVEWDDAEMWLEGAVQSGWSVAGMRNQRWETLGKIETDRPVVEDAIASETDEDFEPARTSTPIPSTITGTYEEVQGGPRHEGPDFGDDDSDPGSTPRPLREAYGDPGTIEPKEKVDLVQPFANLPPLPDDLADAFDAVKLSILHHKSAGWQNVESDAVLMTLDALKALILAPSDDTPPF
jgi:hypothetical protein